jgi:NAD-dependent deacetylase
MPGLPRCLHCEALARPAVVWFGEALAEADLRAAVEATACDVFLTVGTSSVVYPAAGLVDQARRQGAFTVEINAEATPATGDVDLAIEAPAEVVLPEVDALL